MLYMIVEEDDKMIRVVGCTKAHAKKFGFKTLTWDQLTKDWRDPAKRHFFSTEDNSCILGQEHSLHKFLLPHTDPKWEPTAHFLGHSTYIKGSVINPHIIAAVAAYNSIPQEKYNIHHLDRDIRLMINYWLVETYKIWIRPSGTFKRRERIAVTSDRSCVIDL